MREVYDTVKIVNEINSAKETRSNRLEEDDVMEGVFQKLIHEDDSKLYNEEAEDLNSDDEYEEENCIVCGEIYKTEDDLDYHKNVFHHWGYVWCQILGIRKKTRVGSLAFVLD